ncbi:hypothetical protein NEMIN01_0271, partial [Nematocida minor]|uniref:uncharacterized protein n=1 Tax=Nematocida minor TaxID=1912983 RepID=UPI00221E6AC5
MKDQKLRKMLSISAVILVLLTAACQGSRGEFDEKDAGSVDLCVGEKRKAAGTGSSMNPSSTGQFIVGTKKQKKECSASQKESNASDSEEEIDIMTVDDVQPMQVDQQVLPSENKQEEETMEQIRQRRREEAEARRQKEQEKKEERERKQEELRIQIQDRQRKLEEAKMERQKKQEEKEKKMEKKELKNMSNINASLWNNRRLENKRRRGYKTKHEAVHVTKISDESEFKATRTAAYQRAFRNYIKNFSEIISEEVEKNKLWYCIACESTYIRGRYKALLTLRDLFKNGNNKEDAECTEKVRKLEGYYPSVFDEMIKYKNKHQPMLTDTIKPLTEWKETLGDVYLRKNLQPNYHLIDKNSDVRKYDEKYHETVRAVCMVLVLPEVYEDFSTMDIDYVSAVQTSDNTLRESKNKKILLPLHRIIEKVKNEQEVTEDMYKNLYDAFVLVYSAEEMLGLTAACLYRDMYISLADFYENAKVYYEIPRTSNNKPKASNSKPKASDDKPKASTRKSKASDDKPRPSDDNKYILLGKPVIKHQKHAVYTVEADIESKEVYTRAKIVKRSIDENNWTVSANVCDHYHVYYLDNDTNYLRLLCMPIYEDKRGVKHYLHTIDDIVEYIKDLHGIEPEKDHVHPFKVDRETSVWSYVKEDEERRQTVKDFAGHEVVFYRIEED